MSIDIIYGISVYYTTDICNTAIDHDLIICGNVAESQLTIKFGQTNRELNQQRQIITAFFQALWTNTPPTD